MSKLKSDLKVFVSDEILDLRTFDEKYAKTSSTTFLSKTLSQDAIDVNKLNKDVPVVDSTQVTTENISTPLYNSTATLADKYRNSRVKGRSRTVDPRFRKTRSPPRKILTASQSTIDITTPSMSLSQVKRKPFSPSHLPSSTNRDFKKPPKYTRDSQTAEPKSPVNFQHKHAADKEEHDSCLYYTAVDDEVDKCNVYVLHSDKQNICKEHTTNIQQEKYDIDSIGDACNISPIHSPEITEDDIEESQSQNNPEDMDYGDGYVDKISPYWHDPRLLEKHDVMQPVRSVPMKNSAENPILAKDSSGFLVCRNCLTTQWITPEYKYDDQTEICNSSFICNDGIHRKYSEKGESSTTVIPYMVLGSAVGMLIISFVAWFVSQHVSWDVNKLWPGTTSSPPQETSVFLYIKNCGENVLYWMDTFYTKAYDIIAMPRSGILHRDVDAEEPHRWWSNKVQQ